MDLMEIAKVLLFNYTFKIKQLAFIRAIQFVAWYLGGYKAGKTWSGVCKDIILAFINRPFPGMLVHPTFDGLTITILPLIEEICAANNIEYEVKKLTTKYKVFFKFGVDKKDWGVLYLASGDVPKSLKGPKLAWVHVDEPLIMKEEICEIAMSRCTEAKAKFLQVFYTGTPEPLHMLWGFDIVDQEELNDEDTFITTMSAEEVAEFLPPNYIENMRRKLSPEKYETFVKGKYRNISQGRVYGSFTRERNIYDPLTDTPVRNVRPECDYGKELVISYDFNVKQMSAVLWELYGRYKVQFEEYRIQSKSNTRQLTRMIIQQLHDCKYLMFMNGKYYSKYGRSIIISGDRSGKSGSTQSNDSDYEQVMEEFEKANIEIDIHVPDVNPGVRDRTNYMNDEFELGFCLLSNKCKLSIRDRELTSWVLGSNGFVIDKSKPELTHLAEAGDYGVWNTIPLHGDADTEDNAESDIQTGSRRRY
jgi:hypothetical protein